ncbi:MAG TPA: hypothetical protein VI336_00650, partial [Candidatus Saccharimonadales bacterium]|nr:hypothetical protein [Candidatus Saccharimonadales bacterium]
RDGETATMIPEVSDGIASTTIKRTPEAFGVPMNVRVGNTDPHVFPLRKLKEIKDVHRLMSDMVEAVKEQSDGPIVYGLPPGAKLLK